MNLSDESSNSLNNNANNYADAYPSYIEAFRTAVSLPPPLFGHLSNNTVSNIENENEELREQMYEFNNIGNFNNANNNSFEDLTVDKPDLFRNIEFNIIGVGSISRDEKTKEKTKTVKEAPKRKKKIIKNKGKKTKSHSYYKEKEKIKIKQLIEQEEEIKKLHQKDFNCIVNNKRKRKSEVKEKEDFPTISRKPIKKRKITFEKNEEILKVDTTFHLYNKKHRRRLLNVRYKSHKSNYKIIHEIDKVKKQNLKIAQNLENIRIKKIDNYKSPLYLEGDIVKKVDQFVNNKGLICPKLYLNSRKIVK